MLSAADLRGQTLEMFATRKSVNDIIDEVRDVPYSKADVIIFLMIYHNTLLESLAKAAEKEEPDLDAEYYEANPED